LLLLLLPLLPANEMDFRKIGFMETTLVRKLEHTSKNKERVGTWWRREKSLPLSKNESLLFSPKLSL
jgi:predicted component of type VI protein secretion system